MPEGIDTQAFEILNRKSQTREFLNEYARLQAEWRHIAPDSSLIGKTIGMTQQKHMRHMGRVPDYVHIAAQKLYGNDVVRKPEFWRWFFKRYPQYSSEGAR